MSKTMFLDLRPIEKEHELEVHIECSKCSKTFTNRKSFAFHESMKCDFQDGRDSEGESDETAGECSDARNSSEGEESCDVIDQNITEEQYTFVYPRAIGEDMLMFRCLKCSYYFLKRVVNANLKKRYQYFICEYCYCLNSGTIKELSKFPVKKVRQTLVCPLCPFHTVWPINLRVHKRMHAIKKF